MAVIASQSSRFYFARMPSLVRLLTMIAVLLIPFGMAAAPAAAIDGHHSSSSMTVEHCPENAPADAVSGGPADCAMPCSAAVPPAKLSAARSGDAASLAVEPILERALAGILLEIATPPPKRT